MSPLPPVLDARGCADAFTTCDPPLAWLGLVATAVPLLGVAAVLAGAVWAARARRRPAHPRLSPWALLAPLVPLVALLALDPAPVVVYFDEFLHGEVTAQLARHLSPFPCCAYVADACVPGGPLPWPVATHLLAAPLAWIAPGATDVAQGMAARSALSTLATLVAPVLAALWVARLLEDRAAGALAGLLLAVHPVTLRLVASGALMPPSVALLLLTLLLAERVRAEGDRPGLVSLCGAILLTLNARHELALALPWLLWRLRGRRAALLAAAASGALGVLPPLALFREGAAAGVYGWVADAATARDHLEAHLAANLRFLVEGRAFPPALVPLAVAAVLVPGRRRVAPAALTALAFLALYSAYYIGSFDPEGTDAWRYTVPLAVFMLPAAARFGGAVLAGAGRLGGARLRAPAALALAAACVAPLATQGAFLTAAPPLADFDARVQAEGVPATPTLTRSVAFARARLGGDVVQRCAAARYPGLEAALDAGTAAFLRCPGDRRADPVPGVCLGEGAITWYGGPRWLPLRRGPCSPEGPAPAPAPGPGPAPRAPP